MIQNLIILAILFLALFAIGEWLYHKMGWRAENSRKVVHSSVGILALSFPFFFEELWPVVVLCSAFLLILILSLRFNFLPSINKVKRDTIGSVLFPIIVACCFWLSITLKSNLYYYIPIVILAVCDPLAALAGNAKVEGKKSFRGSFAFFLSALIIASFLMVFNGDLPLFLAIFLSSTIALTTTIAEYVSKKGWDNLSIPLTAVVTLFSLQYFELW